MIPQAPEIAISYLWRKFLPAWFDMKDLTSFEQVPNSDSISEHKDFIQELIREETELLGDSRKVIVGGFAQGGTMAILSGLNHDEPLGAVMCF